MTGAQRELSDATGKTIILVGVLTASVGDEPGFDNQQPVWAAYPTNLTSPCGSYDRAERVAAAQAWIAAQEDPTIYELVAVTI